MAPNVKATGTVKFYSLEKSYGFIQVPGLDKDVFLHVKQWRNSGMSGDPVEGEPLSFEMNDGPKGKFATNITRG